MDHTFLGAAQVTPQGDPNTYEYAMRSPDAPLWQTVMEEEMASHKENGTWTPVDLPKGRKTVKNKWVYVTKHTTLGKVTCHKARLVAKGFSQTQSIDY